jgi:hypothetical protein
MIWRATNGAANRLRQNFAGPRVPVKRSAEMGADGEVVSTWRPKLASSPGRCIRPDRVRCIVNPRATGAKSWSPRGEHEVSRNPFARGKPDDPVALWSTRALLCTTAGAIDARLSLRPLFSRRVKSMQTSGDQRREKARCCHTRPGRLARLDRACQRLRRRDLRAPLGLRPRQAALTAAYATVRFSMILRKSVARLA